MCEAHAPIMEGRPYLPGFSHPDPVSNTTLQLQLGEHNVLLPSQLLGGGGEVNGTASDHTEEFYDSLEEETEEEESVKCDTEGHKRTQTVIMLDSGKVTDIQMPVGGCLSSQLVYDIHKGALLDKSEMPETPILATLNVASEATVVNDTVPAVFIQEPGIISREQSEPCSTGSVHSGCENMKIKPRSGSFRPWNCRNAPQEERMYQNKCESAATLRHHLSTVLHERKQDKSELNKQKHYTFYTNRGGRVNNNFVHEKSMSLKVVDTQFNIKRPHKPTFNRLQMNKQPNSNFPKISTQPHRADVIRLPPREVIHVKKPATSNVIKPVIEITSDHNTRWVNGVHDGCSAVHYGPEAMDVEHNSQESMKKHRVLHRQHSAPGDLHESEKNKLDQCHLDFMISGQGHLLLPSLDQSFSEGQGQSDTYCKGQDQGDAATELMKDGDSSETFTSQLCLSIGGNDVGDFESAATSHRRDSQGSQTLDCVKESSTLTFPINANEDDIDLQPLDLLLKLEFGSGDQQADIATNESCESEADIISMSLNSMSEFNIFLNKNAEGKTFPLILPLGDDSSSLSSVAPNQCNKKSILDTEKHADAPINAHLSNIGTPLVTCSEWTNQEKGSPVAADETQTISELSLDENANTYPDILTQKTSEIHIESIKAETEKDKAKDSAHSESTKNDSSSKESTLYSGNTHVPVNTPSTPETSRPSIKVESPWGNEDEELNVSFRRVCTWPRESEGIPVIFVDEAEEEEEEMEDEEDGEILPGLPGLTQFLSAYHAMRTYSPCNDLEDDLFKLKDTEDDLVKLKAMTQRLNLATRRQSYTEWKDRYLNKPLLWRRRSCMTFNNEVKDIAHHVLPSNNGDENNEEMEDDEGWSEERTLRIDNALDWLRKELAEMRGQDQVLARRLITLREDLREFKLRKCCAENQVLIEEALDQEEERDVLSDLSDLPPSPFSPTLKNYGVTRMNISARRFSVF